MKNKMYYDKLQPTREAISRILENYGIAEFTFEIITRGISNTTIRIQSGGDIFIMRVYSRKKKTDSQIIFELHFQDYLREHEIPIPRVCQNADGKELTVCSIDGKSWQVILIEFVEGSSKTTRHTPELIMSLASIQARMHLLGAQFSYRAPKKDKSWKILSDYYAVCFNDISGYQKDIQDFIIRAKNFTYKLDLSLPCGFNHLDFDLDGNVIVKDSRINGIIDFDDLSFSPSIVCLGYSLWNVLHDENIEKMKEYLACYEKIRPLNNSECVALPNIILFRNYEIGALRLHKTGNGDCLIRPFRIEKEMSAILSNGLWI